MKKLQLTLLALRVPVDLFALLVAAWVAYRLRYESFYTSVRPVLSQVTFEHYASIVVRVALLWILLFAMSGLYGSRRIAIRTELLRVIQGSAAGVVALIALMFWQQELFSSRFIVLVAFACAIVTVSIGRLLIRAFESALYRHGLGVTRVAVIGTGSVAEALAAGFVRNPSLGFRVDQKFPNFNPDTAKKLRELSEAGKIDEILLADPNATKHEALAVLDFAEENQLNFKYSADLLETATKHFDLNAYSGVPVIEFKPTRLEGWGRIYKRVFDILVSTLLILVTSPIMLLVAIAVALDSRGPIFFSQSRIGEKGRAFTYFKFRSMRVGAHEERSKFEHLDERKDSPMFKIKNDPRVTRVGRFIRRYSLDELPEFFLVLLGRMSLVGPRPHLPEEVAKYKPRHRKVHNVKPGISGLAQISGRADLPFDEEVRLDLYYMENWSPWLDLYILAKTPFVVFSKKGAY